MTSLPSLLVRTLLLGLSFLVLTGCESLSDKSSSHHRHRPYFSLFSYKINSDGQQCLADWRQAPPLPPSLWRRVESRYQLPNSTTNPRIIKEREWYTSHQAYLNRVSARSARYLHHVESQLEARHLPGELALLPIVESAYNPFAISTSNASGLWQFIPSTAKHLKMEINWWYDARRDIPAATDTALNYLVFLRDHYDGDWLKALAAYNAGWGTIDKAVAKNQARGRPTDYWSLDVPAETAAYVPKLLALAQISQNPAAYGIDWAYIPDLPYFAEVHFSGQLDIGFAADMANVDSDELHMLNPGISRWATPPGGPYRLLVPIDQANDLQERIASMNTSDLMPNAGTGRTDTLNPYVQALEEKSARTNKTSSSANTVTHKGSNHGYTVKKGDTLWSVSRQAGISPDALRKLNHLNTKDNLKPGQKITLPNTGSNTSVASTSKIKTSHTTNQNSRVSQTYNATDDNTQTNKKTKHSKASGNKKESTSYTVKSGDTLMAIARKYNIKVDDVMRWNAMSKSNTALKPGQHINLHLD